MTDTNNIGDISTYIRIIGQISYKLHGFPDAFISTVISHYYGFISGRPTELLREFPLEHMQLAFYDLYTKYYYNPSDISEFDVFFSYNGTLPHRGILHMLEEAPRDNDITELLQGMSL